VVGAVVVGDLPDDLAGRDVEEATNRTVPDSVEDAAAGSGGGVKRRGFLLGD